MGNTAAPTLSGSGAPIGDLHSIGDINLYLVPFTTTMSASYATGGDTLTLPQIKGKVLRQVIISGTSDATRLYRWNLSAAAPTIQAYSALGTEAAAATNLGAVTVTGLLIYGG